MDVKDCGKKKIFYKQGENMKYSRKNLKKQLKSTIDEIQLLKDSKTPLSNEENQTLLANEEVISTLKEALSLFETDFNKSCELICEIPYLIVSPSKKTNLKKYKFVGSNEVYSRTDSLRHHIRMLSESDFSNKKIWNNTLILGA